MFQLYSYYSLFVGGWCFCNIIWLLGNNEPSIVTGIITILLVAIQIIAPIVWAIHKVLER